MKRILLCLLAILLLAGCTPQPKVYDAHTLQAFDTVCRLYALSEDRASFDVLQKQVFGRLTEWHALFDAQQSHPGINGLFALNQAAGAGPFAVEEDLFSLIAFGVEMEQKTNGAVNIAMGRVTALWKSATEQALANPEKAALPDTAALAEAAKHTRCEEIVLDAENLTVSLPAGMQLDLGAVAKGWAAERLAEELTKAGYDNVLLDLGGNLRAVGKKRDTIPWSVGIADPRSTGKILYTLPLDSMALVTSGDYHRYFELDGQRYCHIIDPTTSRPSRRYASVSVLSPNAAWADALTTALFNLSVEEGKLLLQDFPGTEALWITPDRQEFRTQGMVTD